MGPLRLCVLFRPSPVGETPLGDVHSDIEFAFEINATARDTQKVVPWELHIDGNLLPRMDLH
jgi:hypothetical protein